jgi:cbb3-type cytochrome oxidase subunit 3
MLTYSQKLKLQEETRKDYGDAGIKTLKMFIFLTVCLRSLFTRATIFIAFTITQSILATFLFYQGFGSRIFLIAIIMHFLGYTFTVAWAEKDGMRADFEEQDIIYRELKAMLAEKRNASGDQSA